MGEQKHNFWVKIVQKVPKTSFFWPVLFENLPARKSWPKQGIFSDLGDSLENQFGRPKKGRQIF